MAKFSLIALLVCSLIAIGRSDPTGRVVGGVDANESDFPYQVSLRRNGSHSCGGSIITRNYILTAAHCVTYEDENGKYIAYPPSMYEIRAGSNNRFDGGVLKKVKSVTFNENYGSNLLNDLALLLLETPLIYSKNIQPIKLASQEVPTGAPVIISGWGRVDTEGDIPLKLQWNTLVAMSKTQCLIIGRYTDALLCLAHESGNGACFGDSGGPARYNNELVGVAGFVVGGCGTSFPDGYAKVFYHIDWIKEHSDM